MIRRLPVFIGGIVLGVGLTYLGGWPFRILVAVAWLGLMVETSLAVSQSLGLPVRKYLWVDALFFGLLPAAMISGRIAWVAGLMGSWLFLLILLFPTNRTGLTRWLFSTVVQPYLAVGVFSFFLLRQIGWQWPMCALAVVVLADTGAYVIGRQFGKRLLAPSISPAKTIEGAVGGIALAGGGAAAILISMGVATVPAACASIGLAVLAVLGDLFESFLKRGLDLKDFGTTLPGHGGFFDRLDSLLPVSIALLLFLKLS